MTRADSSRSSLGRASPPAESHRLGLTRHALSLAVALMGVVDLASAILSHPPERLLALRRLVPTVVLDTSRTFTLLAGALLLVTAWGLRRGKRRAFVAALLLCAVSVPVNLFKAIDVEEATVAAGLMFALGVSGDAFRVKSRAVSGAALGSRAMGALVALLVYAVAGAWMIKSLYGYHPALAHAFQDAAHNLFGFGGPAPLPDTLTVAQRRIVRWYLHSLPVMSFTLVLAVAIGSLRPAAHRRRHRAEAGVVASLLRRHGASTVSAFALDDANDYFFSDNRRAVIAYRFESDTLLTIGDPIGPTEEMPALLEGFEGFCVERDWQFGFFQARPELLPVYHAVGWRSIHIGEDPILWTDRFTLAGGERAEVRRAVKKAETAGLQILHFRPDQRPFEPERRDAVMADALRAVSNEWLRGHAGGEKDFCMGRFETARLAGSGVAIAWNPAARRVEGFVTWVPIWARRGWALDLMRRRADSATGAMELLVARSVATARDAGDAMLSLSLSALAQVEPGETPRVPASPESSGMREFLMQRLGRFYDFQGLFRWKRKFAPAFEDRYLVVPGPFALPQVALALARVQSPGGLRTYLGLGRGRLEHEDVGPVASEAPSAGGDDASRPLAEGEPRAKPA